MGPFLFTVYVPSGNIFCERSMFILDHSFEILAVSVLRSHLSCGLCLAAYFVLRSLLSCGLFCLVVSSGHFGGILRSLSCGLFRLAVSFVLRPILSCGLKWSF